LKYLITGYASRECAIAIFYDWHTFSLAYFWPREKFEMKTKTSCHLCKTFSSTHFPAISFFSSQRPHTLEIYPQGQFPTLLSRFWAIKMMVNYQMARHTFAQLPQLARFTH